MGGFRIGADGEATSNKIPYVKSEMYLTGEYRDITYKVVLVLNISLQLNRAYGKCMR